MYNSNILETLKPDGEGTWPLVIVPSALWKRQVPRILAQTGKNTFGLRVETVRSLAGWLTSRSLAEKKQFPMSKAAGLALALRASEKSPGIFSDYIGSPGFAKVLFSTITMLRDGAVSPQNLRSMIGSAGYYAPRIESLAGIYENYLSLKDQKNLFDYSDMLDEAINVFKDNNLPENVAGGIVLGHHLHTGIEKKFMNILNDHFNGMQVIKEPFASDSDEGTALQALKKHLFSDTCGNEEFDNSFMILACHGDSGEVREALRFSLEQASEGIDFQHQAVLLPSPSPWSSIIKGLASGCDADIPLDGHAQPPLSTTRPGRALLALQTLASSGISAKVLFDLLRSGLIKFRDRPEFDSFENVSSGYIQFLCREARIVGSKDWGKRLSDYTDILAACADEKEKGIKTDLTRKFRRKPATLRNDSILMTAFQKMVLALQADLENWIESTDSSSFFRKASDILTSWHPLKSHRTDSAARKEIISLLSSIPNTGISLTINQLGRMLRIMLEQKAPPHSNNDGVLITDIESAAGLPFTSTVMMGLSERTWPPPPSCNPFLSDKLIEDLGLVTEKERAAYRRKLFAAVCHASEKHLRMTYSAVKPNEFKPGVPSSYALSAEEAVTGGIVSDDARRALPPVAFKGKQALERGEFWLGRTLNSPETTREVMIAEGITTENVLRLSERRRGNRLTDWDGIVSPELAVKAVQRRFGGLPSPTGLECYAKNPLHFLYTNLMNFRVLEDPEEEDTPDQRVLGSMIHDVLERYLKQYLGKNFPPDTQSERDALSKHTGDVFREYMQENNYRNPLLYRLLMLKVKETLHKWLSTLQEDVAEYLPAELEMSFGMDDNPPVQVDLNGETFSLSGRIDRVDKTIAAGESTLRIIDYKSGKPHNITQNKLLTRFNHGKNLQLGCYAVAAASELDKAVSAAGYTYLDVNNVGKGAKRFIIPWTQEMEQELMDVLSGIISCIRSGFFPPGDFRPWSEEEKTLCGFGEKRIEWTSGDPRWAEYRKATHHEKLPEGGEGE